MLLAPTPSLIALAAALAASVALAACGGSSPTSTNTAATDAEDALKFSRCMREHGVTNFPNPETSGGLVRLRVKPGEGASPAVMEAAQRACRHYSPEEQVKLTPQEKVALEERVQRFAKCMREHGIHVETSTKGGGVSVGIRHPGSGPGSGPNPESPAFEAAQKACNSLLPRPPGAPPGGPFPGPKGGGGSGHSGGAGPQLHIGG